MLAHLQDVMGRFMEYMPFAALTARMGNYGMYLGSIVVSLVIAGVTGLVVNYGTQKYMESQIDGLRTEIKGVKETVDQMRWDLYRPVSRDDRAPRQRNGTP